MSYLYQNLVDQLIDKSFLKNPVLISAFRQVNRKYFVLPGSEGEAHHDFPLLIGYGQTISQPATVAFMLELLNPKAGGRILDVGAGSGWQAALLGKAVGRQGEVFAIERIPELVKFAQTNIAKLKLDNVQVIRGDGSRGYAERQPYDGIVVAAAADNVPRQMLEQLKIGGRLVIPVGETIQTIKLIRRVGVEDYKYQDFPGFRFVPLVPHE